ncbi:hypothetical protein EC912_1069 [Luteibacter rhizovicinus]|uniref:DUF4124 domain-containing protein n=1 Tax=Luteibacter rhizovicinus TaxID=242606 RepID=A0A4R3YKL2_9GAMM|nr:DUF4124 domain-containing protein [Luteibacter rhizovicinus]TCV92672.1 hypothetical protein EC912_1069 [Luteibacter rhizovicinus]
MRILLYVVVCAGLYAGIATAAQDNANAFRYKWRDSQGHIYFSDSLSSEAIQNGYDVVNSQGVVVKHIDRALTPDERIAARKVADQRAADELAAQNRQREDMQMLNAYPDEASFTSAKTAEVETFEQAARTTRLNLQSQEKTLAELLSRGADLERAKQPLPPYLSDRITEQRNTVATLRTTLQRQQQAKDAARTKADAQLQHYRELRAAQKPGG